MPVNQDKNNYIEKLLRKIDKLEQINSQLKSKNKLFNKTQNFAKIGSWMYDLVHEKIELSDEIYNIIDISNVNSQLSFEEIISFIHPSEKERALTIFEMSVQKIKNFDFVTRLLTPRGIEKNIRIVGEFEIDKFKQPKQVSGLAIDITQSVLYKDIEDKFKVLFEKAPDGIFATDKNGLITICNSKYADSVNSNPQKLIAVDPSKYLDRKSEYKKNFQKLLQGKGEIDAEYIHKVKNPAKKHFWYKTVAQYNHDNSFKGAITFSRNITPYKEFENALKQSEEKYKILIEQAVEGIFIGNKNGDFIMVNQQACEMTGYSKDELLNMKMSDLFMDKELANKPLRYDLVNSGEAVSNERIVTTKQGNKVYVQMKAKKLSNGLLQAMMHDISQYKKNVNELAEREALYKGLYNNSSIGLYRSTPAGKVLMANPTLVKLLGFKSFDELSKKNIKKGIYKDNNLRIKLIAELEEKNEIKGFETEWVKTDGSILNIRENARAYKDKNGRIEYIEGTIEDITSRVEAQKALELSEENFRLLFEKSPLGIFTASPEGKILNANTSLLSILGSPSLEATKSINILKFKPLVDNGFAEDFVKCFQSAKIMSKEYYYTSKWGKTNYLWGHLVPLVKEGKVEVIYTIIENVTAKKEIENELIKSKEKAEEADRLKTTFLANMSHEIRTPMNAIVGFTELLGQESLSKKDQNRFIEIINVNTKQLLQLINDILDISKIEVGQLKIDKKECNLNILFDKLYHLYKNANSVKKLKPIANKTLRNNECTIITDETRLWQILSNLINNAYKYTHSGFIEFGYYLPKATKNTYIQFYVKDTGIGIAKEKLEIIFNPFIQSEKPNERVFGGAGLGLSISKGLVELLGGKIWVESIVNKGSTFYFTLPYKEIKSIDKMETNQKKEQKVYTWKGKTILVVEDNEPNFIFIREIVKKTGVVVVRAISGTEAIAICENQAIDLVLMDIRLPEMDGYEATRLIKQIKPDLPIIAQTAYAMSDDRIKCYEAGCNGYFSKPVNRKELLALINQYFI